MGGGARPAGELRAHALLEKKLRYLSRAVWGMNRKRDELAKGGVHGEEGWCPTFSFSRPLSLRRGGSFTYVSTCLNGG